MAHVEHVPFEEDAVWREVRKIAEAHPLLDISDVETLAGVIVEVFQQSPELVGAAATSARTSRTGALLRELAEVTALSGKTALPGALQKALNADPRLRDLYLRGEI